jgi:hypothetical protein
MLKAHKISIVTKLLLIICLPGLSLSAFVMNPKSGDCEKSKCCYSAEKNNDKTCCNNNLSQIEQNINCISDQLNNRNASLFFNINDCKNSCHYSENNSLNFNDKKIRDKNNKRKILDILICCKICASTPLPEIKSSNFSSVFPKKIKEEKKYLSNNSLII